MYEFNEYEDKGTLKGNSIIKIKEFEKYAVCIEYYSKKNYCFLQEGSLILSRVKAYNN